MTRRTCAITLAAFFGRNLLRAGQEVPAGQEIQEGPAPSSDTIARPRPSAGAPPPAAPPPPPAASAPEPKTAIRVNVELVNVLFSVRKKDSGELVPTLTKDDFTVLEDGKEQTITQFSRETDLPLKLGLLIDVSRSQTRLLGDERDAASKFISSVMRPKSDEAFLLSFGHDTTLEQDFTDSASTIEAALKKVQGDSGEQGGGGGNQGGGGGYPGGGGGWPGGGGGRFPGGGGGRHGGGRGGQGQQHHAGTRLYDAIYLASNDELSHKSGRKALLLITDGNDRGSYYTRSQAVEAAQRSDAIIYSIYYADTGMQRFGQRSSDDGAAGLEGLKHMSEQTGGRAFTVDKKHPLQQAFASIQAEMRSQYTVAWKPANKEGDGDYREIEVRPKSANYVVQARKGYYATANQGS
jgi:VWFA-related protein